MVRNCLIIVLLLTTFRAEAAATSPLLGTWSEVGGPGIARIEPCVAASQALCAMGLARNKEGRLVETGVALSDLRPDGSNRWKGAYHHGRQRLSATVSMIDQRRVKLRVCMLVLCQTAIYVRSRD